MNSYTELSDDAINAIKGECFYDFGGLKMAFDHIKFARKIEKGVLAASVSTLGEQHTDEQAAFEAWWNANETWPVAAKNLARLAWTTRAKQPQAAEPKGLTDDERAAIKYARSVMGSVSWETCDSKAAKDVLDALLAKGE